MSKSNQRVLFDYKGKEIEEYLTARYGSGKTEIAKLLLSHPLFDIMVREGPCVSFETYVLRYFSILLTFGDNFIVSAAQSTGIDFNYCEADDVFSSVARHQLKNIKARLHQLELLRPVALSLPSYGVNKRFHQHIDNTQLEFWKKFDVEEFLREAEALPGFDEMTEMVDMIDELRSMLAESDRQLYLEIAVFADLLLALRTWMEPGLFGCNPTLAQVRGMGLPEVSRFEVNIGLLRSQDVCIAGKYKDDQKLASIKEDMEDMAEEVDKAVVWDVDPKALKYKVYVVGARDIFTLVNSKWVPNVFSDVDFVRQDRLEPAPASSKPKPTTGNTGASSKGTKVVSAVLPTDQDEQGKLAFAVQYLKDHFNADLNANGNELVSWGGDSGAKLAWMDVSAGFKRDFLRSIETGFEGTVEEALLILGKKIDTSQPRLSPHKYSLAVGAICRSKAHFRISGDSFERVGQRGQ